MRDGRIQDPGGRDAVPACAYCPDGGREPAAVDRWPPDRLAHLYLCRGLSTYVIAGISGIDRQRVTRLLRRAGVPVRPRGAGRLRPVRRNDPPGLPQLMARLYEVERLGSAQVAMLTGLPERTVRDRLRRYGIRARSRGRWNREDRRTVPDETLRDLYEQLGLTANRVGELTGMSRHAVLRSAHALGVPVRTGGVADQPVPNRIELVRALYADDLIAAVLAAHDIPRVPPGGPHMGAVPRADPAHCPSRQRPVLVLRGGAEPYRAAHRAAGHDRARVHAPRGHPAAESGRTKPLPDADGGRGSDSQDTSRAGCSSAGSSSVRSASSRLCGRHRFAR